MADTIKFSQLGEISRAQMAGSDYAVGYKANGDNKKWTFENQADFLLNDSEAGQEFQETFVKVQNTEPTDENNKIWIEETPENEVEVPTYDEFKDLSNLVSGVNEAVFNKLSATADQVSTYIPFTFSTFAGKRYIIKNESSAGGMLARIRQTRDGENGTYITNGTQAGQTDVYEAAEDADYIAVMFGPTATNPAFSIIQEGDVPSKVEEISDDVEDLKSALSDLSTNGTGNIFNDAYLSRSEINRIGTHEFSASAIIFATLFGSDYIPVTAKPNTPYKLSLFANGSESNTGNGITFKYVYSDSTESYALVAPNTTTTKTRFTATDPTSASKTLIGIKITYGSQGNTVWTISDILLTDDLARTEFIPYLTANDRIARNNITDINSRLTYIDAIIQDVAGVLNPKWIACDVDTNPNGGWIYYDRIIGVTARRVAPAEGYPIHLREGDVIGLSDYSDARYFLRWKSGDSYYQSANWLTEDTTIIQTGDYVPLIAHLDNRLINSVSELSDLFIYNLVTLSEQCSDLSENEGPKIGYSYNGERISLRRYKYRLEDLDNMVGQGQDCVVYENYVLAFSAENGTCKVTDIETKSVITTFNIPTVENIIPHFNTAVWGDKAEGETIPLLYVNVNLPSSEAPGLCAVYQIRIADNVWSVSLVQTINVSFVGDNDWGALSTYDTVGFFIDGNMFYAFGASQAKKKTNIVAFNIPTHETNKVLTRNDIVDSFNITYMEVAQGCMAYGGILYAFEGLGTVNNGLVHLYAVDLKAHMLASYVDMTEHFTGEPEFIFTYNGNIILGAWGMVKLIS